MKKTLLFFTLLLSVISFGQTNIWTGATNNNWEENSNWSSGIAPADDVNLAGDILIPDGSTVVLNFGTAVNTITIEGNSNFTHIGVLRVLATATIASDVVYNWYSGRFTSGGTINNYGTINLSSSSWVFIESGITLNNFGELNMQNGTIYLNDGTINNQNSGIIDFKNDDTTIGLSTGTTHLINNYGLIKKSIGSGVSALVADIHNFNNSTIQVETGSLDISGFKQFDNGSIFNVSSNAVLTWIYSTTQVNGAINGIVNGNINLQTVFTVSSSVSMNFTGNGAVNWISNSFVGTGNLTNNFNFNISTTSQLNLNGYINFVNNGTMNFTNSGSLNFNNGTINNMASGIIDLKSDGQNIYNNSSLNLNNYGIFKKTFGSGVSSISCIVNNYGSIINAVGTMDFSVLNNFNTGIIKGNGTINLPSGTNFINDGTFAPGMSPGTLTVIDDFKSTTTSVLDVELNGTSQGILYDLLVIQGNAIFYGTVNVTLGFAPVLNSEFTVATTTGTITQCNLPLTVSTIYNGNNYTFNLACITNNKIVLTLNQITLSIPENVFEENSIVLFPNPTSNYFNVKNNSTTSLQKAIIRDFSGRKLTTLYLDNSFNETKISMKNYASGYYFIEIYSDNKKIIKKIIKQ